MFPPAHSDFLRVMPLRVVPTGEKFEFLTLLEPHKAYQGSVAMLRRLDPEKEPRKFRHAVH